MFPRRWGCYSKILALYAFDRSSTQNCHTEIHTLMESAECAVLCLDKEYMSIHMRVADASKQNSHFLPHTRGLQGMTGAKGVGENTAGASGTTRCGWLAYGEHKGARKLAHIVAK